MHVSLKILALMLISLGLSMPATADELRSISVQGEAVVKAVPDKADLAINLFGKGKTAAAAKEESDKKLKSLYKLMGKYGIDKTAVNTNHSSVQPQYDYRDGKRLFREYQSQHRVTIEIDKLDAVADISDELVDAGVDRIESLQYGIKDDTQIKQEALVRALRQAKQKAEALSRVAGAQLGHVISITENGGSYHRPPPIARSFAKMQAMDESVNVAPPTGEVEVQQTIHAVFELE